MVTQPWIWEGGMDRQEEEKGRKLHLLVTFVTNKINNFYIGCVNFVIMRF